MRFLRKARRGGLPARARQTASSLFAALRALPDLHAGGAQRGQNRLDLLSLHFEPRRQDQLLAQVGLVLVATESRPVRRQFEEHPARFAEVDGAEPEPVDLRSRD